MKLFCIGSSTEELHSFLEQCFSTTLLAGPKVEYSEGDYNGNQPRDKSFSVVTLHDFDDSSGGISPSDRSSESSNRAGDEHVGEFHSAEQSQHGADQDT